MGVHQHIGGMDRVTSALVEGLEREFGSAAGAALAERFLRAEAADFHWEARLSERWLGSYESLDEEGGELDRVAICGQLDGAWFAAICLVDGEGRPHGLMARRAMRTVSAARKALAHAR